MPYTPKNPKKPNTAYKRGTLSRPDRFGRTGSKKRVNPVPFVVLTCLLISFVAAVVLGAYLGDKAELSKNTATTPAGAGSLTPPDPDKTDPRANLNAFIADMTGADPEESLSLQTEIARERGNALYIPMRDSDGKLIYSSDKTDELSYPARDNLTLSRLVNHFEYYVDFAIGYFESDFSPSLEPAERMKVQSDEIILIAEATENAFGQIIVAFESRMTKNDLIYYQTYLVNLKLACEGVAIGVELDYDFLLDADNSGIVSDILSAADFYCVDLGAASAEELGTILSEMVYLNERYGCIITLSDGEDLSERITELSKKNLSSFIVKN